MTEHFSTEVIRAYVKFLYTATLELKYSHNIKSLIEMAHAFGHGELLEDLCRGDVPVYLDAHGIALQQLQRDFLKLLNESHEHKYAYFADTELVHARRSEEEAAFNAATQVHRVFINRSPFLRRCFRSGMEESQHGRIRFEEIGPRALQTVMKYLYTDELQIELDIVPEIYISAKLFQMARLQEFCRTLLLEYMDADNVLDLLNLAEMYVDEPFLQRCWEFIGTQQVTYDSVSKDPRFLDGISEQSRRQIELKRLECKKRELSDARLLSRKKALQLQRPKTLAPANWLKKKRLVTDM
jgi:BTB/POZ domain